MTARRWLLAGLVVTSALAFSGFVAETTGIDLVPGAAASCTNIDLGDIQTGCIEQWPCQIQDKWPCIE